MAVRDVVAVACSAGGLAPLRSLVGGLPEDLPASVLVVRHLARDSKLLLPVILNRDGVLPVDFATDGEPVRAGRVRIAPPDQHLTVHDGSIRLAGTPKINRVRPSADALFRSLARWYGPRVVAVVLSGMLDDGAAGAAAVAARGGAVVVQNPADADFASMPREALAAVPGALSVPTAELAVTVLDLLGRPGTEPGEPARDLVWETDLTGAAASGPSGVPGRPAGVSCPDCHGAMNRIETSGDVHYRCHVGHAYSPASLVADQEQAGESALWQAVALLEEQAVVHHEMALRAARAERRAEERAHAQAALDARRAAAAVKALIPGSVSGLASGPASGPVSEATFEAAFDPTAEAASEPASEPARASSESELASGPRTDGARPEPE
ncbi:MAG: chemotaxis protein CheB [Catenulispora sp.]